MQAVFARWDEIAGPELSEHVRPVRVDSRVLVVAADHPAWATRARMHSGRILAQVAAMGDRSLERLEVLVERA
jgi:predicted nucleic acid-binding Zn ribbon protein